MCNIGLHERLNWRFACGICSWGH